MQKLVKPRRVVVKPKTAQVISVSLSPYSRELIERFASWKNVSKSAIAECALLECLESEDRLASLEDRIASAGAQRRHFGPPAA